MIRVTRETPLAIVTLDRPQARNALTGAMMSELIDEIAALDDDPEIRAIILTGTDPAFCAGLDLKDLAATYDSATVRRDASRVIRSLLPMTATPIIGAVNGAAVTGGLELAMGCDFLIASHRASFADTHARVGVMPSGGMSIRLPQLIGINRARQMSLTGNFVDAGTACEWGLVNEVVPHGLLMDRARELALAIAECEPAAVVELRALYLDFGHRGDAESFTEEARRSRVWMRERFSEQRFSQQRDAIIERGSRQQ